MRKNSKDLSIAIAVHPTEVYDRHPAKNEMQQVLDGRDHDLSIVVTNFMYDDTRSRVYVKAIAEWVSPKTTYLDIKNKIREKMYGHGYGILNPEDLSELNNLYNPQTLRIVLVGGEVGGSEGCHHAAFVDIVEWFYNISPIKLQLLEIIIPVYALFTSQNKRFDLRNKKNLRQLQGRYEDSRAHDYQADSEKIIVVFKK